MSKLIIDWRFIIFLHLDCWIQIKSILNKSNRWEVLSKSRRILSNKMKPVLTAYKGIFKVVRDHPRRHKSRSRPKILGLIRQNIKNLYLYHSQMSILTPRRPIPGPKHPKKDPLKSLLPNFLSTKSQPKCAAPSQTVTFPSNPLNPHQKVV